MSSYSDSLKYNDIALNSAGTTQQKYNLWLQGTEAHLNRLKNAGESVFMETFNSKSLQQAIDTLTVLVQFVGKLIDTFGVVPSFAFAASMGIMLFSKNARDLASAIITLIPRLFAVNETMAATDKTAKATAVSVDILKGAVRGLVSATIIGAAIAALSYGVEYLVSKISDHNTESEKAKQFQEDLGKTYLENGEKIDSLANKYEQLKSLESSGKLSASDSQELVKVQNDLNKLVPSLTESLDEQGNARLKNVELVKTELEYSKQLAGVVAKKQQDDFKKSFDDSADRVSKLRNSIKESQQPQKQQIFDMSGMHVGRQIEEKETAEQRATREQNSIAKQAELNYEIKNTNALFGQQVDALVKQDQQYKKLSDSSKLYLDSAAKSMKSQNYSSGGEAIGALKQFTLQKDALTKLEESYQKMKASGGGSAEAFAKTISGLREEFVAVGGSAMAFDTVLDSLIQGTNQNSAVTEAFKQSQQDLSQQFMDTQKVVSPLNEAIDKLNSGHKMSQSEIEGLISKYPDLMDKLQLENGQMVLTKEAIMTERDARIAEFDVAINTTEQKLKAQEESTQKELDLIGKKIESIQTLAEAEQAAAELSNKLVDPSKAQQDMHASMVANDAKNKTYNDLAEIIKARNKIKGMKVFSQAGGNYQTTSDNPASNKSTPDPYVSDEYQKQLDALDAKQKRIQANTESYSTTSIEYRNSIQQEIDLLRQKQDLAHNERLKLDGELATAQSRLASAADQEHINKYAKEIDDVQKKISQLGVSWMDYAKSISEADRKIQESTFKEIADKTVDSTKRIQTNLTELDTQQKKNEISLATLNETSSEYSNIQQSQIDIIVQKQVAHSSIADAMRDENIQLEQMLTNQSLDLAVRDEINTKIESNIKSISDEQKAWQDLELTKKQTYKKYADDIISSIKNTYEQEKKIALDTEDMRHKKRMDNIDAETKKYEDSTSAIIKQLDRQTATEDYNSGLKKEQDSRAILQRQIDALSIDDSPQAKSKVIDLKKQLVDQDEKIERLKNNRETDLRKQNLQDQLDEFKNTKQKEKDTEDTLYQQTKDLLQKEYDSKVNNEQLFSQIRRSLYEGDTKFVLQQLELIKKSFTDISKLASDAGVYIAPDTASNIDSGLQTSTNSMSAMQIANAKSKIAEYGQKWQQAQTDDERSFWHDQAVKVGTNAGGAYNEQTGKWTFPESFDTGGYTGSWGSDGKIGILHEKELILEKGDTENVLKSIGIADRIANMFFGGDIPDLMSRVARFVTPTISIPKLDANLANNKTSTSNTIHLEVNIDKVMGGKAGADSLIGELYKGLNGHGIVLS